LPPNSVRATSKLNILPFLPPNQQRQSTEGKKLNQNITQNAKPKHKPTVIFTNCLDACAYHCTFAVNNTAQNSSDNFPSYPPDNHHSSDDIYWKGQWPRRIPISNLKYRNQKHYYC